MLSKDQPGDLNNPTQSLGNGDWPPSLLRLVLGAVVAAGLSYVALKTMYPIFEVPVEIATFPEQSPLWLYERLEKTQYEVDGKNLSIVFAVIGAIFGASCVVFSFGARSVMAIVIAVLGSASIGVAGANLSNWMFGNMRATSGKNATILGFSLDGMTQSIIGYSLLWGLIGLGVGLGIGSVRGFRKSLIAGVSGLFGGALGAMLYVVLTAQFSIGTTMNQVLPASDTSQAIWMLLFAVTIAVCIALGSGEKKRKGTA
jgi:hypothetical protein